MTIPICTCGVSTMTATTITGQSPEHAVSCPLRPSRVVYASSQVIPGSVSYAPDYKSERPIDVPTMMLSNGFEQGYAKTKAECESDLARLRAELDEAKAKAQHYEESRDAIGGTAIEALHDRDSALSRATAAESKLASALEALVPFAEYADAIDRLCSWDDAEPEGRIVKGGIHVVAFRRARSALASLRTVKANPRTHACDEEACEPTTGTEPEPPIRRISDDEPALPRKP
jgi:hypothetical protein